MAGISDYRRGGYYGYDQTDHSADTQQQQNYPPPVGTGTLVKYNLYVCRSCWWNNTHIFTGDTEYVAPVSSGRVSSRGDYYSNYNYGGSRAISPYSVGTMGSPRLGGYPTAYNLIDGAEGS